MAFPGDLSAQRLRTRIGLAALGAYVLLYASWQAFRWIPLPKELLGSSLIALLTAAAICMALRASLRTREQPRLSQAWRWVALALGGQLAGTFAQIVYEHVLHRLAYPTVADVFYLSFYPLLLVGILRFPAARRSGRQAIELALDCAIVALGGGAVFVYLILGPNAVAASTPLEAAASVAYPIGDMILLVGLGTVMLRDPIAALRDSLRLMALAVALFIVGDLVYGYVVLHGTYHGGDPLDTTYMLAFACFALAGAAQQRLTGAQPAREVSPSWAASASKAGPQSGERVNWIPYLAVAACGAIVIAKEVGQPLFPDLSIAIIVVLVTGLVVVRQALSQHAVRQSRAWLARDIAARRRMERELGYQADHDPLTGLYNRHRFARELDHVLRFAERYGRAGALLILDVDNFKLINDAHGHATGDAALKAFAQAVAHRARKTDIVARLGGDEIAIVLPIADESRAVAVAQSIRAAVQVPEIDEPVHVSVGIALFDGSRALVADDIVIAADIALYEAKENGRDQIRVYSGETSGAVTWAERIRGALAEDRFVLYIQPIVDVQSGRVTHGELLIRMLSDGGDVVPPSVFLPTADRLGLMGEIDRWVVREGLALARRGERVSINLSAHSIGDETILDAVRAAIADGVDPGAVIFEITETAAMANMQRARVFAETLGGLGCEMALDDFGTGFGSFTYLKHLPTRYLKIDMEFVRDMVSNRTDQQVVESIARIAHSLGKLTIAEGVEDEATLHALRRYGVDRAQGYFVGKPRRISPPTRFEAGGAPRARRPRLSTRPASVTGIRTG